MRQLSEIIKASLLGTEKYMYQENPFEIDLVEKILQQNTEKEDKFLKSAYTAFVFHEAGLIAPTTDIHLESCLPETKASADERICNHLKTSLQAGNDILFQYLIHLCIKNNWVVSRSLVPTILNKALANKKRAESLVICCGETGKWLCKLNPEWEKILFEEAEENIWETGTFGQRKAFLQASRKQDPQKALALLEEVFNKENAANREEFLSLLEENISLSDESFLASCTKDKSQKVKDKAYALLKTIRGSQINQLYLDYIKSNLILKEERKFIITKKKQFELLVPKALDEALEKTGIAKISSEKGIKDHIFWLGQILSFVHPDDLSALYGLSATETLHLLLEYEQTTELTPYLQSAAIRFQHKDWAKILLNQLDKPNIQLITAFPKSERTDYCQIFIETNVYELCYMIFDEDYTPIPSKLAMNILQYLRKHPHALNSPEYLRLSFHFSTEIIPDLLKYLNDETDDYQNRYFKNQITEMINLLDIKKELNIK
ncbi:MAG: hypothetical protein K1X55_11290 [Chitinophagales bacterium]|nr:hypothetical protein [Chitinophagales bacterium]